MASRDKNDLHQSLAQAYDMAAAEYARLYPQHPQPFITCTHRSNEEQDKLYAQGRTQPGKIVTNAKAGQSKHNSLPSKAFDIAFITYDKKLSWDAKHFIRFAEIVKRISTTISCGCDWKFIDNPHFELK